MIHYFDWLPQLEAMQGVVGIPDELALFAYSDIVRDSADIAEMLRVPHKIDSFMMVFHVAGSAKVTIDMVEYNLSTPNNSIRIMPSQIILLDSVSEDFDAHVVVMSKRFVDNLLVYINGSVSLRPGMRFDVVESISADDVKGLEYFVKALRRMLQNDDNPYRMQVVQHSIMAIFYSSDKLRDINIVVIVFLLKYLRIKIHPKLVFLEVFFVFYLAFSHNP